ncbi:MAG: PAS domain S-box protein [Lutibacter sp.]|nr:PAS domain S-box protein [Lutibacter sp.]
MSVPVKYIEDTLAFISENGYETKHTKFLKSTAVFLAELFGVNYVIIDKYSLMEPTVTETVVLYGNGGFMSNFSYKLKNTPCANVINWKACSYPTNVKALFPKDDSLVQMNIDSYLGIPLWSSNKEPIGLIALMDTKPLKDAKTVEIILQIIAIKVEKVLEKMLFENALSLKVEELKIAKEIAEKNENQLKEAQKIANLGYWEHDIINNKLIWSDEIYRILNLKPQELEAREDLFVKNVHPDDKDKVKEEYLNAFKNKKAYQVEYRLMLPSGDIKYILGKGHKKYDDNGNPIYSFGTVIDITKQKEVEQKLVKLKEEAEKSEKKFKKLSNLTFEGILIHEMGVAVDANLAFGKMFGYGQKELIGKNIIELLFPEKHHQIISKSIAKNYVLPYEIEGIKKDGTIFPIEIEARDFISENNKTHRVAAVRDITERKKHEAANKKLSIAVEQSANSIIITDVHGNIEYTNPKFTEITGYTAAEVLGKNPRVLSSGKQPKEFYSNLWQTIIAGKIWKGEFQNKAKNGNFYWERTTITPIKNEAGEISSYIAIKEDISKNKEAEEKLREAAEAIEKSEKKFRELFEKSGDAILIIKNDVFVECNQATVDMLGYKTKMEFLNTHPSKLSPKLQPDGIDSLNKAEEMMRISLINGTHRFEWIHTKSNGELFTVEVLLTAISNEPNNQVIHCVWRDIANRKKAELQLLKQNEEYRVLSEDYLTQNTALQQLSNELSEKNKLLLESKDRFINLFEQNPVPLWEQDFSEVIRLLNQKKTETYDLKAYLNENFEFLNECIKNIKIINVNNAALDLFGVKNNEELKIHLKKTNSKKALEVLKMELVSIGSNKKTFNGETELTGKDGSLIFALIKSVIIDDYGTSIASVIDITPLKNATNKLQKAKEIAEKSKNNLNEAQKIAQIGSYELDFSMGFWKNSPTLNDIFGIDEKYNRNINGWLGIIHPEDLKMIELYLEKKVIGNKEEFNKEYRSIRNSDKQIRWVHDLGKLEFDNHGNIKRLIGIVQDISEKRQILQDLTIAKEKAEESNQLKTEFIQNMSHEIRTPMNGILGFTDLLENPDLPEEKRKKFIEIIKNSTHQLLHIIDDLMEISVLETKQIKADEQPVCLNDLLFELFTVFEMKANKKNISLVLKNELSDKESAILTDNNKLNKVLGNLLENALKFTNEGIVELGYKLNNDIESAKLEIFVKDSGIGIKPEKQALIFERFSQAEKELSKKVGGLGLGLSIAKENTELLGGKITVVSELGKGAAFFVTIPYKPVNLTQKIENEKIKEKADNEKKHTILIAEDEDVNYMVLEILLEDKLKFPCIIIHAKDGMEAVELCKNIPEIDLVLMDIKMPKMDGHEATKRIKEFRPNLPIIAQTAYSAPEEKEKAFLAGCDDFMSKPISKDELKKVLDIHLLYQFTQ